jgi:hypothetical protein
MPSRINTDILVVGGGPVGLTLAMDLARRGIGVTLCEIRAAGEPPSVRCNHVSARTMEIFRQLGVVHAVRDAGLPADFPNDVAFRTTATGIELGRIPIPCRAERYRAKRGPDTWWPTPEPPHRINQIYLEPVLFAHAVAIPESYEINLGQFCCGGLNFGYFYASSPIIAYDGEAAPTYTMYEFRQSTVPGCRTPHLWLRDGRSLYDALGLGFNLLRFDPMIEIGSLVAAAARRAVPMAVLDVDANEAAALYPCKLLLSRPDQHVAWRGDKAPADPLELIDLVRGASGKVSLMDGSRL